MSKHTPGPWRKQGTYVMAIKDGKEELVAAVDMMYSGHDEIEANAQLIAAAPDLLEACNEFVADILKHAKYGLNESEVDMLKLAEKAIAKAEGGKHEE